MPGSRSGGSHATGGLDGPDHRCDFIASIEEAELRGCCDAIRDGRAFPPFADADEAEGAEGIIAHRRWRASGRRAPADEIEWVMEEFRTHYLDFTAKHF